VLAGGPRRTPQRRGYSFVPQRRRGVLVHERVRVQPYGIIVCDPHFFLYLYTTYMAELYMFMEYHQDLIRSLRKRDIRGRPRDKIVTGLMTIPQQIWAYPWTL